VPVWPVASPASGFPVESMPVRWSRRRRSRRWAASRARSWPGAAAQYFHWGASSRNRTRKHRREST
jgi:hypothetical protein